MGFLFLRWASRLVLAGIFLHAGYIKLESPLQFAASQVQLGQSQWVTGIRNWPDHY